MNVYDSGQILQFLKPLGYEATQDIETADLIIVNTCTIREKAEQKAFSFLGRLAKLKKRKPRLMIGIGGCVAQQEGHKIVSRMPYVDLVFGTHAIFRLPKMIEKIEKTGCRIVDIKLSDIMGEDEFAAGKVENRKVSSFVTIMRGCDNFCTYCVVPHVRGREASRHPDRIVEEIESLVSDGVKEITLLGQNVNSYGLKEGLCTFSELLKQVNEIKGLERIRFTTSHPKDLSKDLMTAFKDLDKLCNHIHLPIQSGSDKILKKMNRKYTKASYLDKVLQLRKIRYDMAMTTDIIVGFPGETDADFEQTLDLLKTVEFDGLFAFMYSDRPNVPAASFGEKVPDSVKKERLQKLLDLQETYTLQKNKAFVGKRVEVLVEGPSKRKDADPKRSLGTQWSGRTRTHKIVNFTPLPKWLDGKQGLTGKTVDIMIEEAHAHSLRGRPADPEKVSDRKKGAGTIAA